MIANIVILSVTFGFAWIVMTYREQAQARGWPTGGLFYSIDGQLKFLALASILGVLVIGCMRGAWWYLLAVPVLGMIVAFFALQVLRSAAQFLALFGLIVGIAASIFLVR